MFRHTSRCVLVACLALPLPARSVEVKIGSAVGGIAFKDIRYLTRSLDDLPKTAQAYVAALEEMSGAPISAIGVGPGRDETVQVRSLLG